MNVKDQENSLPQDWKGAYYRAQEISVTRLCAINALKRENQVLLDALKLSREALESCTYKMDRQTFHPYMVESTLIQIIELLSKRD